MSSSEACWLPLESNPDVMNKLIHSLGVPNKWIITDVYGLDPDMLAIVPRPVLAVVLLYPITERMDKMAKIEEEKAKSRGQTISENLMFIRQYLRNACGTIALIHSIGNNVNRIKLNEGPLKQFFLEAEKHLYDGETNGKLLAESFGISDTHQIIALEGQTEAPDPNTSVDHHFVALVEKDGFIYELDGRKSIPINRGKASDGKLLEDCIPIIKHYIESDPENIGFNVVALCETDYD